MPSHRGEFRPASTKSSRRDAASPLRQSGAGGVGFGGGGDAAARSAAVVDHDAAGVGGAAGVAEGEGQVGAGGAAIQAVGDVFASGAGGQRHGGVGLFDLEQGFAAAKPFSASAAADPNAAAAF